MQLVLYCSILFFGCLQYIIDNYYCNSKISKEIKYACLSLVVLLFNYYNFYFNSIYVFYMVTVLELSHYISDFIFSITTKKYSYALHHIFALVGIPTAINAGYIDLIMSCFFAASITNIFLAFSSLFNTLEYRIAANISVGCFVVTFFASRICYGTYLFYNIQHVITDKILLLSVYILYLLQVYWFVKIIKFAKKVIK